MRALFWASCAALLSLGSGNTGERRPLLSVRELSPDTKEVNGSVGWCNYCVCCNMNCTKEETPYSKDPPPFSYHDNGPCGNPCGPPCGFALDKRTFNEIVEVAIAGDAAALERIFEEYPCDVRWNRERQMVEVYSCGMIAAAIPLQHAGVM